MSTNIDCDVLIAGAGPTGMSAAIALHDAGFDVTIIDKHETGLSFSRAILVNSRTLALLKPYGVADKIISNGHRLSSITINGPNGAIMDGHFDTSDQSGFPPTSLPQLETESCFLEGLTERGINVTRPCALKTFNQKEDRVEALVERNGQYSTIRSLYLLGADGFHSVVREELGVNYNRSEMPLRMYSQDAVIDWSGRADINIWILDTGGAIAIKMANDKVRFAATCKETFLALELSDRIEQSTWESEFDVYFAQVDAWGDRRVWLAGDAAHAHSPVGGRGMNMGIADGIGFAQAVAGNDFIGYQRVRHAVSSDWVRKNKLFTEIVSDKSFRGRLGRSAVRSIFILIAVIYGKKAAGKLFESIAIG